MSQSQKKILLFVGVFSSYIVCLNASEQISSDYWEEVLEAGNKTQKNGSALGYIAAGISILGFGTNFIPVKQFETGDGMFFQWILCIGIWHVGLVVNIIQNFPPFHPEAMLGGFLWSIGNLTVVPIVKTIGLGLGFLIWGTFNLLAGWASGRFGWFGLKAEVPSNPDLNYVGVSLAVVSVIIFIFVKSEVHTDTVQLRDMQVTVDENEPLLIDNAIKEDLGNMTRNESSTINQNDPLPAPAHSDPTFIDKMSPLTKRIVGITISVLAGIFYGINFAPVLYVKDNYPTASQNDLDYEFAHFCGILAASTFYLIVYCAFMKNKPRVYPKIILPGFISGVIWAIAMTGWFIANRELSEAVSFPIVTTGPGLIAALVGVVFFKEIKGLRNYIFLGCAFAFTATGSILGITISVLAGIFYGINFAPVLYVKDNYPTASQNDLDYEFAHFCGILAASTFYLIVYCAFMKNKPRVYPKIILPGFISGVIWAIAMTGWFIANRELSEAVSFPIVTTGPGLIAALVGVVFFKEIKGLRNYIFLGCAFAFTATGSILSGLSK